MATRVAQWIECWPLNQRVESPYSVEDFFCLFLYTRWRRVVLCRALCRDVRLSVFLCPLHNSDTVQDIFMKLGSNVNHHQTMCREQEPTLNLHFSRNYGPLKCFLRKSCPLYYFDTVQNIYMKLCRNIKPSSDDVQRTGTDTQPNFSRNYAHLKFCPFEIFLRENRVCSITLIPSKKKIVSAL